MSSSSSGHLGREDDEAKVPGAAAPICNALRLWNSMARWLFSGDSEFKKFVYSFCCNSRSAEERTADYIWPMPVPYPVWLRSLQDQPRVPYVVMSQQKAVNMAVLALDWLHLKKPVVAPKSITLHSSLTTMQWSVVRRLERFFTDVTTSGDIGPEEMARTAAKVEGLDFLLHDLHEKAMALDLASKSWAFALRQPVQSAGNTGFLRGNTSGPGGEVVGMFDGGVPTLAKEIDPSRLSFPQDHPRFDPAHLLEGEHLQCYKDPVSLAESPDEKSPPPPRVRVHVAKGRTRALLKFLDQHHRLVLAPAEKVRASHLCGAFALTKDISKDRLIIDARGPNLLEHTYSDWVKTLGSVSSLLQIELQPGCNLYLSGTDLRDYYYCFRVTDRRSFRNALKVPMRPGDLRELNCFREWHLQHKVVYPCLSTLAMGDNNAVELGQMCHVKMGLLARAFTAHELLCVHGRAPRGHIACGIVIDDVLIAEQVEPCNVHSSAVLEGEYRLNLLCEQYQREGLTAHPKKTFRSTTHATVWGSQIDGESGICRPSVNRLVPLLDVTARTAKLGIATVALLQVLSGAWVSVLQYRRRMLSLLHYCYVAQAGRPQEAVIQLSSELISELWCLVALGPLAASNLRAQTLDRLFCTDASCSVTASVWSPLPARLARELHRHSLARGVWSKLLAPWKAFLREHSELDEEDELPGGVPLVAHPLWIELVESLEFQVSHVSRHRGRRHINLLEVDAVLELEKKVGPRFPDRRLLLGADSQVALAALVKGRSTSENINKLLASSLAYHLGFGLYESFGFLPSLTNVADDPTRDEPLRKPCREPPEWFVRAVRGDFEMMDRWLAELGYDPLEVAGLPFPCGVPRGSDAVKRHLTRLREVQKSDRLARFDEQQKLEAALHAKSRVGDPKNDTSAAKRAADECSSVSSVSPPVSEEKNLIRELKQEPESKEDLKTRAPQDFKKRASQAVVSSLERRVAPPASEAASEQPGFGGSGVLGGSPGRSRPSRVMENEALPFLSEESLALLQQCPAAQFFGPDGKRCRGPVSFKRRGILDLYSGAAGVARALSKKYRVWVLCFDFAHHPKENLLDSGVQKLLKQMISSGCFAAVGLAPDCSSFSRAVTPAVRDRDWPEGRPDISDNCMEIFRWISYCLQSPVMYTIGLRIRMDLFYGCNLAG